MKNLFLFLFISLSIGLSSLQAQVTGPAILDLESTNQGLLLPRLTTFQRDNIVDPVDGLVIYNVGDGYINYYDQFESGWVELKPEPSLIDKSQVLTYGPADFKASRSSDTSSSGYGSGGISITSPSIARLICPINLPTGTVITSLKLFYVDESDTAEMAITLKSEGLETVGFIHLYEFNTGVPSSSSDIQVQVAPTDITIDSFNSYFIDVYSTNWSSDMVIKGVQVSYTLPNG